MVDVWLPYGKTEVCVRVPTENLLNTLEPTQKSAVTDPKAEIENALISPIGTDRLQEIAKSGDKVSLVLADCGVSANRIVITSILEEARSAGIGIEDFTLILPSDPVRRLPSRDVLTSDDFDSEIRILPHDPTSSENSEFGKTSRGTKVFLNSAFASADVKILAGPVFPHAYAGYSGGRDGVLPGVSSIETIKSNMALGLSPKAKQGALNGNPIHEDMVEAANLAKIDLSLNLVFNSERGLVKAFCGDLEQSFNKAVQDAEEIFRTPAETRADVTFLTPGGFPFDSNLYESCRCIDSANEITKRGGVIVLVAECAEGYGNEEFCTLISNFKDPESLEKTLKKDFKLSGLIAHRFLKASQKTDIVLVSVLPDYKLESFRMRTARTANEALRCSFGSASKKGKMAAVPQGGLSVPLLVGEDA